MLHVSKNSVDIVYVACFVTVEYLETPSLKLLQILLYFLLQEYKMCRNAL